MCRHPESVRRRGALIASLLLAAAAFPAAQQPAAPPQQQPPPVFRSGVQVIEVDARVFDRDGRFVTGLTRDDFEILEDGVPQNVVALTLVGAAAEATPPSPASPTSPPSTETTTSTSTHAPTTARQTWIFFFDLNHLTPGGGFDRARKAAADFIRERFKDGDLAGIVAGSSLVNNRFTTVRQELLDAVKSVKPNGDRRVRTIELAREWPRLRDEAEALRIAGNDRDALERAVIRACSDDPDACRMVSPDAQIREKAHRLRRAIHNATLETLSAMNALASGLARMAGPKTIVFLSDGFVAEQIESSLRGVVGQVARAGARVYAIDVRGLNRGRGAGLIDQALVDDEAGAPASFDALEDGPNSLAVDTGGMMIRNENNIGRALDTIAADANRYYVIGYQPENTAFDGKYRQIDVRVKREGVRVRARRGYLALEPSKMLTPQPIKGSGSPPGGPVPTADKTPLPPSDGATPETSPTPAAAEAADDAGGLARPVEGAIRIRPDAAARVRALSGADTGTSEDASGQGWAAYQRGDLEAALPLFAEASARPDVRPWVLYALGLTHAGLGSPRDAVAAWERVRTAAPGYAPVYIDLAATYAQMADLTNALAVLRDAASRWPRDAEIHNGIGVILVRREAFDEAIDAFTKAVATAPDEAVTHLNLGRAYELRYARGLRFVSSQRRWTAPEGDRQKAADSYQRCVELGGPYAARAAEALSRLAWSKQTRPNAT